MLESTACVIRTCLFKVLSVLKVIKKTVVATGRLNTNFLR
jgi:hypothetical protein